jgi:hypothetical protein
VVNVTKHGSELQVAGCGLRVAGCGLRVAGCGLRVAGCGLRVAGCELRVAGCGLRVHSVAHRPDDPHRRNCQPAVRRLSWLLVICSSAIREALSVSWRMHFAKLGAGP